MDSLSFLKYILARIGVMIMLVLFSAFTGEILFPLIVSFMPHKWAIKELLVTDNFGSLFGFVMILIFFLVIFYDDGKKQAAYDSWSSINITIVYVLMLLVYMVPSVFRDSFLQEGKGEVFFKVLYYPCLWMNDLLNLPYNVSVLFSMGALLIMSFCMYVLVYKNYRRKHPQLYRIVKPEEENELPFGDDNADE